MECFNSETNDHLFYRRLYSRIIQEIELIENNWLQGKYEFKRIECESEVWCLQYDDHKIISGHRHGKIRIWDRKSLECLKVFSR